MERKYTVDELNGMTRQELREILRPIVKKGQQIPQVDDKGFVKGNQTVSWGIASKNSLIRFIRDKQGEFSLPTVDLPNPYQDVSPRTKGRLDGADTLNDIVEGNFPVEANLPNWGSVDWRDRRSLEEYAISVRSGLESFLEDGVIGTALYDSWREYLDILDSQIETYGAKINTPEDIRRLERQLDEARDRVSPREGRMFDGRSPTKFFGDEVAPQSPTIQDEILRSRKRSADLLTSSVLEDVRQTAEIESGLPPTIQSIREQQQRIAEEQRRVQAFLSSRDMELRMRLDQSPTQVIPDVVSIPILEHPTYARFYRMIKMGQPPGIVAMKMRQAGVDPSILETHPTHGHSIEVTGDLARQVFEKREELRREEEEARLAEIRQKQLQAEAELRAIREKQAGQPAIDPFEMAKALEKFSALKPQEQSESEESEIDFGSGIIRRFYGKGMRRRLRRFR